MAEIWTGESGFVPGGPIFHQLRYWPRPVLQILTASIDADRKTITVLLSGTPAADMALLASWAVERVDGVSDVSDIVTVTVGTTTVVLEMREMLTPGGWYLVSTSSIGCDPYASTADLVLDAPEAYGLEVSDPERFLPALTRAAAGIFAGIGGTASTRLIAPLSRTDTAIRVETTAGWPDTGVVEIEGERIPYAYRNGQVVWGCTRDAENIAIYPQLAAPRPVGTEVRCVAASRQFSALEQANLERRLSTATGTMGERLAKDRGAARILAEQTSADVIGAAKVLWYLDRNTWWALYRVLRAALGWGQVSGTDASVEVDPVGTWLVCPGLVTHKPIDRWIEIEGNICHVVTGTDASGTMKLLLSEESGPYWQAHGLTHGMTGVSYSLMPFRIVPIRGGVLVDGSGNETAEESASAVGVYLYLSASDIPMTYFMDSADKIVGYDPAGLERPIAGKLMADENVSGTDVWPLYIIEPFVDEVRGLISDVVTAGTFLDIKAFPQ